MSAAAKKLVWAWIGVVTACFAMAFMLAHAHAADVAVPAKPFQYPLGTGWYVGIGTEGGAGSASISPTIATQAGLNPSSITTTTIGVHALVGHVWSVPNTSMFAALEARAGWQNFNGSAPGFSFSGPLAFEQRFEFGAPISQIMAFFPSLLGSVTPPPFTPPGGQTIIWSKGYVGFTIDERDVSLNFAAADNKVWAVAPGIAVGLKDLLSGGAMADVYAKVRFDSKGYCVGSPLVGGCGSMGTSFLAGLTLDWGI